MGALHTGLGEAVVCERCAHRFFFLQLRELLVNGALLCLYLYLH
jgi:hypothetical protein